MDLTNLELSTLKRKLNIAPDEELTREKILPEFNKALRSADEAITAGSLFMPYKRVYLSVVQQFTDTVELITLLGKWLHTSTDNWAYMFKPTVVISGGLFSDVFSEIRDFYGVQYCFIKGIPHWLFKTDNKDNLEEIFELLETYNIEFKPIPPEFYELLSETAAINQD